MEDAKVGQSTETNPAADTEPKPVGDTDSHSPSTTPDAAGVALANAVADRLPLTAQYLKGDVDHRLRPVLEELVRGVKVMSDRQKAHDAALKSFVGFFFRQFPSASKLGLGMALGNCASGEVEMAARAILGLED